MRRRADNVDATRQRIVEAAVELHGSIGPAETTILGIAELAGVTRATVYRHFPDGDSLFAACSTHWLAGQRPPNVPAWLEIADADARLRAALSDLYRFYREGESMLRRIYRDADHMPISRRRELEARDAAILAVLTGRYDDAGQGGPALRAAVAHAASFATWRSLCVDGGLSNDDAVRLMVGLVRTAKASKRRRPR